MKKGIIVLATVTMLALAAGAVYFYQLQEHEKNGQEVSGQDNTDTKGQQIGSTGSDANSQSQGTADEPDKTIDSKNNTAADNAETNNEGTDNTAGTPADVEDNGLAGEAFGTANNDTDISQTEDTKNAFGLTAEDAAMNMAESTMNSSDENKDSTQADDQDTNEAKAFTEDNDSIEDLEDNNAALTGSGTLNTEQTEDSDSLHNTNLFELSANESEDPGAYTREDGFFDNEAEDSSGTGEQEELEEEEIPGDQIFAQMTTEEQPTLNQDLLGGEADSLTIIDGSADAASVIQSLAPTTNMSFEELVGDNGDYSFPEGYPDSDTYCLIVDEYYQVVLVYEKDENGEFTIPVRYMLCSTGRNGGTSKGTYTLGNHRVRFGRFVNTDYYAQYWTQLSGRVYFHSILYTERDPAAYVESAYAALGTQASAGCIRLTVPDARWIFYNVAHDSTVIVRYGSAEDEETAAIREQLILAALPTERLALLAGDSPDTDNWSIDAVDPEIPFEQGVASIYQ